MEESRVPAEEIAGISVDAMSSTVLAIDDKGRHLRPAIMWMDVRSSDQAGRIAGTHNDALKYNGYGPVSAEWGLPKALWIKDERARGIQGTPGTSATAATGWSIASPASGASP